MEDDDTTLAEALKVVLGHAVAALEQDESGNYAQSLEEYCDAHQALSCALELHGGGPALLRDTCAALLETYSCRYESIRSRLQQPDGTCGPQALATGSSCEPGDVGRPCPGSPMVVGGTTEVYGPYGSGSAPCAHAAGTTRVVSELYGDRGAAAAAVPYTAARCDAADDGTSRRRPEPPPVGPGCGMGGTPRAACPASGSACREGGGEAAGGGVDAAAGCGLSETQAEVLRQCQRPVAAGGSLDELAGLGPVKEEVRMALLLPARMPHLFCGIRQPPRNFLLHGPPGTGKTMLVERIAAEAGAVLLVVTPSAVLSKWSGESEKQLRAVFEVARAVRPPCIVFMDEVDGLGGSRGSGDDPAARRLLNELLVQMSGLAGEGSGGGVHVFAATNRIQDVDPALLRRFDRRVAVPLPDAAARAALLRSVLLRPELAGHRLGGADVAELAGLTEGYSGSDLSQLCREAAMLPVRELLRQMAEAEAGAAEAAAAAAASTPSSRDPHRQQPYHAAGDRRAARGGGTAGGGGAAGRCAEPSAGAYSGACTSGAAAAAAACPPAPARGAPHPLAPLAVRPLERADFQAALATIRPAASAG